MGMFDFLKLKKETKVELQPPNETNLPLSPPPLPEPPKSQQPLIETSLEPKIDDNPKKEEIDLILNKIETLRLNYEMLQEKIDRIEKMVKEIYDMAKS